MPNQVTLTFAGETSSAERAFSRVGGAAQEMDTKVRGTGAAFDAATERADAMDTRAMGFRDTLTGIQDGTEGVKRAAAGDWGFETLLLLGTGVGDLASGLVNFLIPATKSMTVAKWAENAAWLASPITWIIVGILAVVAVIVLIATKTDWFSKAWNAAWGWIKRSAGAAWDWIKSKALGVWEFLKKIPGWLGSAFRTVANVLTAPFRTAFNAIARLWNNTIGRLSWSVPSWVPFIGGNTISVPNLPTFHAGGVVPGPPGVPVPVMALGGERFAGGTGAPARGGDDDGWIRIDAGELGDALLKLVASAVRNKGGRVSHLGVQVVGGTVRT